MKLLFIIPPFITPNSPYPSTQILTAYTNSRDITSEQYDLSIAAINSIFTTNFLKQIFLINPYKNDKLCLSILKKKDIYISSINHLINFLKNTESGFSHFLSEKKNFIPVTLPEINDSENDLWFGGLERSAYYATYLLNDIVYYIRQNIDSNFQINRYAEKISVFPDFQKIIETINNPPTIIESIFLTLFEKKIETFQPDLIGFSIPFPGCFYSSIRCAQFIKNKYKHIKIIFGGGFCNTEFNFLKEKKLFQFIDYLVIDDNPERIMNIIYFEQKKITCDKLKNTYKLDVNNNLFFVKSNEPSALSKYNNYSLQGLNRGDYFYLLENIAPPLYFYTFQYWNKIQLSRGCYWHRCKFCDTSLQYIKNFSQDNIDNIINNIKKLIYFSNSRYFHFTDEAAPPALLKKLAQRLIAENLYISYFTNIRFDKVFFNSEFAELMSKSGCMFITGGLETITNDSLLKINKGFSLADAAKTIRVLSENEILVHAYLMFGIPGQSENELIDFLEIARQFFRTGLIRTAYLHRFSLTYHSDFYKNYEKYKLHKIVEPQGFADNEAQYSELNSPIFELYSKHLQSAIFNFNRGAGYDIPVNNWFPFKTPKTSIKKNYVYLLANER